MRLKTYFTLRTIILCVLLVSHQLTHSSFSETFDFAAHQSCIVACITSCFIGVIACILFQKYCCNKPTITQQQSSKEKEAKKQILTQLTSKIDTLQNNISTMKEEQKKLTELVQIQKNQINDESLELLNLHKSCILIISLSYHYQQYKEKIKECDHYKQLLDAKKSSLQLSSQKSTLS